MIDLVWTGLAALALLWPSRFIGVLDGAPLDGRVEAIVIGLLVPSLWWVNRPALRATPTRLVIAALLVWKAGTGVLATQQGLCGLALAAAPLHGVTQGIPIEEPSGVLRSWDVRAGWRDPTPACTAILTRPMAALEDFPAWYLNVTDQMLGRRDVTLQARGSILMRDRGTLAIDAGPDAAVSGRVDAGEVTGAMVLERGAHAVDISMHYGNGAWRFAPTIDGAPLWRDALVTVAPATAFDRFLAPWAWVVAPLLIAILVGVLLAQTRATFRLEWPVLAWMGVSAAAAIAIAWRPDLPLHRAAGLVGLGALAVPIAARVRNLRGAFLLVGVPWLVFVAAWSLPQVGRFSVYSVDDWLNYQISGYRIFMHGYWLAGGNALLDFQPLYQWMTGALHVIFGDSSVGEFYWDSACLLAGALLAFQVVRASAGFRWGLAAAVAALATFTLGTPWYFLGRGLSEIAAAGWAFLAMFFLLRGRRGSLAWVAAAGVLAVLMFYTRLNHLILAAFLTVFLLSLRVPATPGALAKALRGLSWVRAGTFLGIFAAGVVLFMTRTWYYTGVFSLFYGTSLRHNDTGLRPWTLFDGEVWAKVWHSLAATVFMNEPPHPDPRAVVMIVGALVAIAAFLFRPVGRRVPAVIVLAAIGGTAGAFLAHAHGYPGRFSIHLIPLACALTMCVAARR